MSQLLHLRIFHFFNLLLPLKYLLNLCFSLEIISGAGDSEEGGQGFTAFTGTSAFQVAVLREPRPLLSELIPKQQGK